MEEITKEVQGQYATLKEQHEGLKRAQELTDSVLHDLLQMKKLLELIEEQNKK